MTAMYTDAKDWLRDQVELSSISAGELLRFILNEVTNDDIERWFGVNMEDDCDNPGAGMVRCPQCYTEVDETDFDDERNMCDDCIAELELDEEEDKGHQCAICCGMMEEDEMDQICRECGIDLIDEQSETYGWWHSEVIEAGTGRVVDVDIWDVDYPFDGVHATDTNSYSRE